MKYMILFLLFSAYAMDVSVEDKKIEKICGVCLEPISQGENVLACKDLCVDGDGQHVFHRQCIEQFLMKGVGVYGCPLCNKPLKDEWKMIYEREFAHEFFEWFDDFGDGSENDLSLVQLILSEAESLPRVIPHLLAMRRLLSSRRPVSCGDLTLKKLIEVDDARIETQEEFGMSYRLYTGWRE